MNRINIVYSLSGGVGVSYVSSFLSCYGDGIGVDLNYQHPTLKRYDNVICLDDDSMIFLEDKNYIDFCHKAITSAHSGFKNKKTESYVMDIGNLLLLEFVEIFKSLSFLDFLKINNIELVFNCVVSGDDLTFNRRAALSFRETFKNFKDSSLVIWENRFFQNTENSGIQNSVEEILGKNRCTYKIIEEECELLNKELREKMKYIIPLSKEELEKDRDAFTVLRLKKYYRKWEKLAGRKEFLF